MLDACYASSINQKNGKHCIQLTKRTSHNGIKAKRVSSLGYCRKLADEIDLFSFRLSKEKSHNRRNTSQEVEKISKGGNVAIKKSDDNAVSSMLSLSSKGSDLWK